MINLGLSETCADCRPHSIAGQEMKKGGFITLHRKILDWHWYDDIATTRLFIHLLLNANHAPKEWRGRMIERGQVVTGRQQLSAETGLSEQQIRTCIKRLKSTNEITSKATNKYTIITLVNYSYYQAGPGNQPAKQPTKAPADNQPSTTNNKENNITNKQDNTGFDRFEPPTLAEIKIYMTGAGITAFTPEQFFNHYESIGWMRGQHRMTNWQAAIDSWQARAESKRDPRAIPVNNKKIELESILKTYRQMYQADPSEYNKQQIDSINQQLAAITNEG